MWREMTDELGRAPTADEVRQRFRAVDGGKREPGSRRTVEIVNRPMTGAERDRLRAHAPAGSDLRVREAVAAERARAERAELQCRILEDRLAGRPLDGDELARALDVDQLARAFLDALERDDPTDERAELIRALVDWRRERRRRGN
ncbi:MAG TPA: hypothetical protein VK923_11955 [Euzebyales bacterium]|nr:hypothetical protein [Euzebyales bacterium]